jgi:hypothetical protein
MGALSDGIPGPPTARPTTPTTRLGSGVAVPLRFTGKPQLSATLGAGVAVAADEVDAAVLVEALALVDAVAVGVAPPLGPASDPVVAVGVADVPPQPSQPVISARSVEMAATATEPISQASVTIMAKFGSMVVLPMALGSELPLVPVNPGSPMATLAMLKGR